MKPCVLMEDYSMMELMFIPVPFSKAPFLGDVDLLTSRELEFGSTKSFNNGGLVFIVSSNRQERLTDSYTSDSTLWFSKSASHSGLQTISACARQHFVDSKNMVRMNANSDVELILSSILHHILVTTDSCGFQSFGRKSFQ